MQLLKNEQSLRKLSLQEEKGEKNEKNVVEDVIYGELFSRNHQTKNTSAENVSQIPVPPHVW